MKLFSTEKQPRPYSWAIVLAAVLTLGIAGLSAAVYSLRVDEQGIAGPFARWRSAAVLVGVSFGIAYLLTWLARTVAPRLGLIDVPTERKCHARPTPLMGGVAVVGTLAIGLLLLPIAGMGTGFYDHDLTWLMLSGLLLCLLGLWDDFKALPVRVKFVGQIAAILPFALNVTSPSSLNLLGLHIPLGLLSIPVTMVWLVSCVNVINLIDGHDGLAASISAIAAFSLAAIAAMLGVAPATAFALLLGGSLVGFLLHNRPPARIFLGDAGSMAIGFFLGAIAVKASTFAGRRFAFIPPLVILSIPFFDAFVAVVRRKLTGRGIGEADRKHIHHRLQEHGLSPMGILALLVGLGLTSAAGALLAVFLELEIVAIVTCGLVCLTLIITGLFAYEETILLVKHLAKVTASAWQFMKSRLARENTEAGQTAQMRIATSPKSPLGSLSMEARAKGAERRRAA